MYQVTHYFTCRADMARTETAGNYRQAATGLYTPGEIRKIYGSAILNHQEPCYTYWQEGRRYEVSLRRDIPSNVTNFTRICLV